LHRAGLADPFCLVDLVQRRSGRGDREEEVRIGVQARAIVTPVCA
jgi:hypothetical protein